VRGKRALAGGSEAACNKNGRGRPTRGLDIFRKLRKKKKKVNREKEELAFIAVMPQKRPRRKADEKRIFSRDAPTRSTEGA